MAQSTLRTTAATAIRDELSRIGMTQQQLAEILGTTQSWVSKRVTGAVPITLDDIDGIADALSLPTSVFLESEAPAE